MRTFNQPSFGTEKESADNFTLILTTTLAFLH